MCRINRVIVLRFLIAFHISRDVLSAFVWDPIAIVPKAKASYVDLPGSSDSLRVDDRILQTIEGEQVVGKTRPETESSQGAKQSAHDSLKGDRNQIGVGSRQDVAIKHQQQNQEMIKNMEREFEGIQTQYHLLLSGRRQTPHYLVEQTQTLLDDIKKLTDIAPRESSGRGLYISSISPAPSSPGIVTAELHGDLLAKIIDPHYESIVSKWNTLRNQIDICKLIAYQPIPRKDNDQITRPAQHSRSLTISASFPQSNKAPRPKYVLPVSWFNFLARLGGFLCKFKLLPPKFQSKVFPLTTLSEMMKLKIELSLGKGKLIYSNEISVRPELETLKSDKTLIYLHPAINALSFRDQTRLVCDILQELLRVHLFRKNSLLDENSRSAYTLPHAFLHNIDTNRLYELSSKLNSNHEVRNIETEYGVEFSGIRQIINTFLGPWVEEKYGWNDIRNKKLIAYYFVDFFQVHYSIIVDRLTSQEGTADLLNKEHNQIKSLMKKNH